MQLLLALLVSCGWPLLVYRSFGWFRRRKAEHRQRLIAAGYKENNPERRHRGDRYIRIAAITYVVISLIGFIAAYNSFPPMMPGFAVVLASWVISSVLAFIPTLFVYLIVLIHGEWSHPQGDVAVEMQHKQFHSVGQPVVPDNQLGSAPIIDAIKQGFTNPAAFAILARRIVEEAAR